MLCELCGKEEAVVSYNEVVGDKATTYHICMKCAQEKGLPAEPMSKLLFSMGDFLSGLIKETAPAEPETREEDQGVRCPNCGLSFGEFRKVGRLGCGQCYNVFAKELKPLLRRIHGSTNHVGKAVPTMDEKIRVKRELKKLREEMQKHIEKEEFEKAARIRDKIGQIEKGTSP